MADESMVPVDQEYGKRQETVGLMREAGVPLASGAGAPPAPAAAGQPGAGGPAVPPVTDFLLARKPVHPMDWRPPDPMMRLRNLAQTSPNPYVRAVLKRMLGAG